MMVSYIKMRVFNDYDTSELSFLNANQAIEIPEFEIRKKTASQTITIRTFLMSVAFLNASCS